MGSLAVSLFLLCAVGHAQTENAKAGSDAAAAKSFYSQGMLALQQRDLKGARAAFEKTVDLAPRSP
ncbi:MAG: hypothetical protein WAN32_12565, partial [Candidatus Acidiferrum sp.]